MLLWSGPLLHDSYSFSSSIEQTSDKKDPFAKPDQIIFDFLPPDKVNEPATSNAFSSPMLNSLFQGIDNREVCGDHKDNNKNSLVDENCSALPSDQNSIIGPIKQDILIPSPTSPPQDNGYNPEPEICGDGEDNDGNGAIDENCGDQQQPPTSPPQDNGFNPEPEICGDGEDNDGNGAIDEDCTDDQPPQGDDGQPNPNPEPEICGDGQDNDGNGRIDEDCTDDQPPQGDDGQPNPNPNPEPEICGDGEDNDGNGAIDENCTDDQDDAPNTIPNPEPEICGDGQDNDGNGRIDEDCGTNG